MTTVGDIYDYIEEIAPFSLQESYDNSGLIIGSREQEVKSIVIALDATRDVALEAAESNAELVITHHPVIFRAIKRIDTGSPLGILLSAGVSVISAHTNFDSAVMNSILCERLGLVPEGPLHEENGVPCGCVCTAGGGRRAKELAGMIRASLGCTVVRYNDMGGTLGRIAVCSGSGGDFLQDVIDKRCDAYITGDVKHNVFIDAYNLGVTVFDAGHFHTENIFCDYIAQRLKENFGGLEINAARSSRDILDYEV